VDDRVHAGQRLLQHALHGVGRRVRLRQGGARGDRHHGVGEVAARRGAQPQPADLHLGLQRRQRPPGALDVGRGGPVEQDVRVAAHQGAGGGEHQHRDHDGGDRVGDGVPGVHQDQAHHHRDGARQVSGEVQGARRQRGAAVPAGRPPRRGGARGVEHDHERQRPVDPCAGRHLARVGEPPRRLDHDGDAGDGEDEPLDERGQVLGLAVPVRVVLVRRPPGDPQRHVGQQRRHQIGAAVHGLRDQRQRA